MADDLRRRKISVEDLRKDNESVSNKLVYILHLDTLKVHKRMTFFHEGKPNTNFYMEKWEDDAYEARLAHDA